MGCDSSGADHVCLREPSARLAQAVDAKKLQLVVKLKSQQIKNCTLTPFSCLEKAMEKIMQADLDASHAVNRQKQPETKMRSNSRYLNRHLRRISTILNRLHFLLP